MVYRDPWKVLEGRGHEKKVQTAPDDGGVRVETRNNWILVRISHFNFVILFEKGPVQVI